MSGCSGISLHRVGGYGMFAFWGMHARDDLDLTVGYERIDREGRLGLVCL
jgi:hypothetical protein